jgi:multimeric flavodoxin WrbA
MKEVLGIISSPRRLGNSELMVKEISRNIPEEHRLTLLRLPDYNLLPCRACYMCLMKEEPCPIDDDLYKVLDPLARADALIVAAPAYLLGPHSALKRFIDRGLSFYAKIDVLWAKPAVGVAVAGIEGREGHTLLGIQNFVKMTLGDLKRCAVVYGALPGEVFLNDANRSTARQLAITLFGPAQAKEGPVCPLCGGDTFRFLGDSRVRCMLCSNSGTFSIDTTGQPRFKILKGAHELLHTKEDVIAHKEWLVGMKDRFLKNKQALKKIVVDYRKDGEWV